MFTRPVLGVSKPVYAELLEIFESYLWVLRADRYLGECDIPLISNSSGIGLQAEIKVLNDTSNA